MDWHAWHDDYDKPGTPLARRLAAVQDQIRQRREPDLVPRIRDWFAEDGFEPVWVSDPARGWGVGAHRFTANPGPLQRGARMFRFTRRPPTLIFIPNGPGACPATSARPCLRRARNPNSHVSTISTGFGSARVDHGRTVWAPGRAPDTHALRTHPGYQ